MYNNFHDLVTYSALNILDAKKYNVNIYIILPI